MTTIQDALPGDIYTDATGKLWRIVSVCHEPTVDAEEVEGTLVDPNCPQMGVHYMGAQGALQAINNLGSQRARIQKARAKGATGAGMWDSWKRIWRNEKLGT